MSNTPLQPFARHSAVRSSGRYDGIAIALHWLIPAAILGLLCMGLYMTSLAFSPARLKLFNWHKWLGMVVLLLMLVRVLWRFTHRPPQSIPMARWQRAASHVVHALLYALALGAPLVGWVYSSAAGFPIVMFGILPLPDWVAPSPILAASAKQWHHWLAYALGLLVAVHVAAVAKHQWKDRDNLLARMGVGQATQEGVRT